MKNENTISPLVSIGLPFFNPGNLIIEAIRSIFAQTYNNWELILVDDGSSDGSPEIISKISDPRVKVLIDGKHRGLVERLNQIAKISSAKYLARMDADDLMHPNRLEKQVNFLEENPHIDIVDTGSIVLNFRGEVLGIRGVENYPPSKIRVLKWGGFLHPSIMGKTTWFKANLYDPNYPRAEDREIWARTVTKTTFAHISEPLHFYRLAENLRINSYLSGYRSERKVLMKYGPRLVGWPITIFLFGRSLIKSAIMAHLNQLGLQKIALWHSHKPISLEIRMQAEETLRYIRKYPVPGLI